MNSVNIRAININSDIVSKIWIIMKYIEKFALDIVVLSEVFMCNKEINIKNIKGTNKKRNK